MQANKWLFQFSFSLNCKSYFGDSTAGALSLNSSRSKRQPITLRLLSFEWLVTFQKQLQKRTSAKLIRETCINSQTNSERKFQKLTWNDMLKAQWRTQLNSEQNNPLIIQSILSSSKKTNDTLQNGSHHTPIVYFLEAHGDPEYPSSHWRRRQSRRRWPQEQRTPRKTNNEMMTRNETKEKTRLDVTRRIGSWLDCSAIERTPDAQLDEWRKSSSATNGVRSIHVILVSLKRPIGVGVLRVRLHGSFPLLFVCHRVTLTVLWHL